MSEYKIVDNFLSEEEFKVIHDTVMDYSFAWYYNSTPAYEDEKDTTPCFGHVLYSECNIYSNFYSTIKDIILAKINLNGIIRSKINMYLRTESIIEHAWHTDFDFPHKGALFYINTNNGYTILEDGIKIESIANRMLFLDTSKIHKSTTCTDVDRRLNININYV